MIVSGPFGIFGKLAEEEAPRPRRTEESTLSTLEKTGGKYLLGNEADSREGVTRSNMWGTYSFEARRSIVWAESLGIAAPQEPSVS